MTLVTWAWCSGRKVWKIETIGDRTETICPEHECSRIPWGNDLLYIWFDLELLFSKYQFNP